MSIFENWQHNWFGFWRTSADAKPFNAPLLNEIIDSEWNPTDINRIVNYLRQCPVVIGTSTPPIACAMCDHKIPNPSIQRTDGVWIWPEVLTHYVEMHHVRLPDRMTEHIRAQEFEIPAASQLH